jgi:phage gp45-like
MSNRRSEDFAEAIREPLRLLRGMVRRATITLSDGSRWQLLGQRGGTGGDETIPAEPFTGIGFYSRPPSSGGAPEAIAVAIGGAKAMAVVATRDEATRQAVAGDLEEDETSVYNTQAELRVRASGTVEARSVGGSAAALAKANDLSRLRDALDIAEAALTLAGNVPGAAAVHAIGVALDALLPSWPDPTTVLKGE